MKKLIITTLMLSLMLSACNKKPAEPTSNSTKSSSVEVLTNQNDGEKVTKAEDTTDEKDKKTTEDSETKKDEVKDTNIASLIKSADYISRIRITTVGTSTDVNFIEDYKGDLSNIVLDIPKGLKENREYILFYTDGKDGKIVPVSEDSAFIELSGVDDSRLKYLDREFGVKSTPGIVETTDSKKSTTKDSKDSTTKKDTTKTTTKDTTKTTTKETKSSTTEDKTTKETVKSTKETKPSTTDEKTTKDTKTTKETTTKEK